MGFFFQTLYLLLLALNRTLFVGLYLNATSKLVLGIGELAYLRVSTEPLRPGSGGSSGPGRHLLTSHLGFWFFSPLSPDLFPEDGGDTFTRLSITVDVRASQRAVA